MSYWYIARSDELLLDLDDYMRPSKSGCPWGEAFFRRRLRSAILDDKLKVSEVYVLQSSSAGHYHAIVKLESPLPTIMRLVWQLHLGSDLYRGRADLMRHARGFTAPTLLIRPRPIAENFYRDADAICTCTEKHVTSKIMALPVKKRCAVWMKYRGMSPWELFGRSGESSERFIPLPIGKVSLDVILAREPKQ